MLACRLCLIHIKIILIIKFCKGKGIIVWPHDCFKKRVHSVNIINILPFVEGALVDYRTTKNNITRDEIDRKITKFNESILISKTRSEQAVFSGVRQTKLLKMSHGSRPMNIINKIIN